MSVTPVSFFPNLMSVTVGQHAVRGATKEKSRKLDELKAKRKAKDTKKQVKHDRRVGEVLVLN